jgi:hypothetical protein
LKNVIGYLLVTNIWHYDQHAFPRAVLFWVAIIQIFYFQSENAYSSINICRTRIHYNQFRTVSPTGPLYKIGWCCSKFAMKSFIYIAEVSVSNNRLGVCCLVSVLSLLKITLRSHKNPLFCYGMMQTCGGSGASSKGSTWKGQTYRSGWPLLDKLQSYNLLSSSVDSIVNDSYKVAEISNSN